MHPLSRSSDLQLNAPKYTAHHMYIHKNQKCYSYSVIRFTRPWDNLLCIITFHVDILVYVWKLFCGRLEQKSNKVLRYVQQYQIPGWRVCFLNLFIVYLFTNNICSLYTANHAMKPMHSHFLKNFTINSIPVVTHLFGHAHPLPCWQHTHL